MYNLFICVCLLVLHMISKPAVTLSYAELLVDASDGYEYEMPESCNGKSFCFDKGDNYPDQVIAELVNTLPTLWPGNPKPEITIGARCGSGTAECPSKSSHDPIYYIIDEEYRVRVVVQSPKFQQFYDVTWCLNEGRINSGTRHFLKQLDDIRMECVNVKIDFDFIVLAHNGFEPTLEIARAKDGIPVCCRCRLLD